MIDAAPVARALRRLSELDDQDLDQLLAGSPLTRAGLRRALVTGQLQPDDFETALRQAPQRVHPLEATMVRVDEVLAWAGKDIARLHQVYDDEMARDPRARRPTLLSALRDRLGWPLPDTPVDEVLTYAGRPSWPVARVLATEMARPARWRRPTLIAELEARVIAAGPNATSIDPVLPDAKPKAELR